MKQLPIVQIGANGTGSRVERAQKEIVEILKREDLLIAVRTLDISDGSIRPIVEIIERPKQDATTKDSRRT